MFMAIKLDMPIIPIGIDTSENVGVGNISTLGMVKLSMVVGIPELVFAMPIMGMRMDISENDTFGNIGMMGMVKFAFKIGILDRGIDISENQTIGNSSMKGMVRLVQVEGRARVIKRGLRGRRY